MFRQLGASGCLNVSLLIKLKRMNINLYQLLRDAADVLRLRFYPIEHYRYGLPVMLAIMLGVGMVHAVMLKPIFGNSHGVMMLGLVFALLKWLLLTRAMTAVLHYFGGPHTPFLAYTLLTEALVLPLLVLPYIPEAAPFFQFWNIWIFWVQLLGFAKIGQQPIAKVLMGYVVYFVLTMAFGSIMVALFNLGGWLDLSELQNNLAQYLKVAPK